MSETMLDAGCLHGSGMDEDLAAARNDLDRNVPLHAVLLQLRQRWTPAQSAAIVEQAQLQIAARRKFRLADQMRFTRQGLQQATAETVAAYKASQIPAGRAVVDLCCGLGGDLIALAAAHRVEGVERDPLTAALARHNLEVHGRAAVVHCSPAGMMDLREFDWLYADPDRRPDGDRTSSPDRADPPWQTVEQWAGDRPAAIKLAPAGRLAPDADARVFREWIGFQRECREQLVWLNDDRRPRGRRQATVLGTDGELAMIVEEDVRPKVLDRLPREGEFLREPHPAVYAAGLEANLASLTGAELLSLSSPYLVDGRPAAKSLLFQEFEILVAGHLDLKKLRAALRSVDAGTVEWKQRGVDPSAWSSASRIRTGGACPVVVLLFRLTDGIHFAITRRTSG